ncbi:hypothetical protein EC973_005943 [Apophysomyces ossiformis]|uniref:F-box domain-containing protein n=1 Tax=Apophysomyces ossiformis TaxID=679940 RepID=A0A8H7BRQ0_9FUNG|nr:hypothetical protein EC973_005943 [Apophysomyces ossiformis]
MKVDLPYEILVNIATHLPQDDRYFCTTVSRSWNVAFIHELYRSVDVSRRWQLERLWETLRRSLSAHHPLGHLVRTLRISCPFTSLDLLELSRLCPFVTDLDYKQAWHFSPIEAIQKCKYIVKAPEVVISTRRFELPDTTIGDKLTRLIIAIKACPEWIDLLKKLPCIEELKLEGYPSLPTGAIAKISLYDLEKLHSILPRLRGFEMKEFYINGPIPKEVLPCHNVRNLSLKPKDSYLWGRYFARKYRKLEHLHLSNGERMSIEFEREALALVSSCRRLKSFEGFFFYSHMLSLMRPHLEILREVNTQRHAPDAWSQSFTASIIYTVHRTISTLNLSIGDNTLMDKMGFSLQSCTLLVKLQLQVYSDVLEIDRFLDVCSHLKELVIEGSTVTVSNVPTICKQHKLQKLKMKVSNTAKELFPYLSEQCPDLSDVTCEYRESCSQFIIIWLMCLKLRKLAVSCNQLCEFKVEVLNIEHGRIDNYKVVTTGEHDDNRASKDAPTLPRVHGHLKVGIVSKVPSISIYCLAAARIRLQGMLLADVNVEDTVPFDVNRGFDIPFRFRYSSQLEQWVTY